MGIVLSLGTQDGATLNTSPLPNAEHVQATFLRHSVSLDEIEQSNPLPVGMHIPRSGVVRGRLALTDATEQTLIAGVTNIYHDIFFLVIGNKSSTLVHVDIRDATGGTIIHTAVAAANGGGQAPPTSVYLPQTTAGQNWTVQSSDAVSTVYVTAFAQANQS